MAPPPRWFESRAFGPGFRRFRIAVAVVVLVVGVSGLTGCGSAKHSAYGGLPKFLPKSTIPVGRVVNASAAKPQLAVQGAMVSVTLGDGHVLATVVGPVVPPFIAPPPPAVTATFTVTLTQAHGKVPVQVGDFTIRDQTFHLIHPQLVTGETPPPAEVPPNGDLAFKLTAVLPTGEGQILWSPSGTPVVSWDFTVEND